MLRSNQLRHLNWTSGVSLVCSLFKIRTKLLMQSDFVAI